MKAYLIDPVSNQITEVAYSGDFRQIYEHIKAETFDVVTLHSGDALFVDDEGLCKPNSFFKARGIMQPLAGRALVLGTDEEGGSVEPTMSIEQLRQEIMFLGGLNEPALV